VGITRAKKELIITWNSGRPNRPQQQAVPFIALQTFWEGIAEADRLSRSQITRP